MFGNTLMIAALTSLAGAACAAEAEVFTGKAARSGTYKRPLLVVDGKRYELKASDNADKSVAELLKGFSDGDTGRYVVKGTRGTVNGGEGIIIDSIAPAANSSARLRPPATPRGGPQNQFNVYDDVQEGMLPPPISKPYTKSWRLGIPIGVTTVKGILVVANCAGGDSRDWYKGGTAYEVFCQLHGFAFVGSKGWGRGSTNYPLFVKALANFAKTTGHPELVNVPYVATGVSAGGGFSSALVT